MTHDYKEALEFAKEYFCCIHDAESGFTDKEKRCGLAIVQALKIVEELMQEPSEDMNTVGQCVPIPEGLTRDPRSAGFGGEIILKAMSDQFNYNLVSALEKISIIRQDAGSVSTRDLVDECVSIAKNALVEVK